MDHSTSKQATHSFPGYVLNVFTVSISLGIIAAILAIVLDQAALKYIVASSAGVFILVVAFSLGEQHRLTYFFIALFSLSISFYLDINYFVQKHIGGAASVNISLSMLTVFVLYILLFYNYTGSGDESLFQKNRILFWAPLFYIITGILSFINAEYPGLVFLELIRLTTLFLIFFLVMNLKNEKQIRIFIFFLSVGVFIEGAIALIQYKTGSTLGLEIIGEAELVEQRLALGFMFSRATGTTAHPNILGYYFEILIPIIFAMLLVEEKGSMKFWYFIAMLFGFGGILVTLSRAAWITLPVSLPLVFFSLYGKRLFEIKTGVVLFIVGIFFIIGLYFAYPTIERRLLADDYRSAQSRIPLNLASLSIIKQYPVLGVGLNNFAEVFKRYDTTGKSRIFKGYKQMVHNLYLAVWVDVGTLGLVAFLWIFVSSFIIAGKLLFKVSQWQRGLLVGITAGLLAHLIHGLFDPGFRSAVNISTLVYSLLGLIGAVSVFNEKGIGG